MFFCYELGSHSFSSVVRLCGANVHILVASLQLLVLVLALLFSFASLAMLHAFSF
jgi:hypothetical protein